MIMGSEQMPTILDGTAIAAAIKQEVAEEVKALALKGPRGRPRGPGSGARRS